MALGATGIDDTGARFLRYHSFDQDGDLVLIEITRFARPDSFTANVDIGVFTYHKTYFGPQVGNATVDIEDEYSDADFDSDTEVLCQGQGSDQCEFPLVSSVRNYWRPPQDYVYDLFNDAANGRTYEVQQYLDIPNGDTICLPGSEWPINTDNPFQMESGALVVDFSGGAIAGKAYQKAPSGSWRGPGGAIISRWCLHGRVQYYDPNDVKTDAIGVFYKSTIPGGHHPINGRHPSSMSAPAFYRYADVRNTFEDEPTGDEQTEVLVEVVTDQGSTPTPRTTLPRVCFPPRGPNEGSPRSGVSQAAAGVLSIYWAHDEPWLKFKVERADDAGFSVNVTEIGDVDQIPIDEPIVLSGSPGSVSYQAGVYYLWKFIVSAVGMTPGTDYYFRVRAYYHADNRTWSDWVSLGTGSRS